MNPTDTPSLSELVARLRESIASKETYNPERVKLMREAAEMLAVTDYGYREVCKKNDELQALVKLQTDTLSRLSGNGGGDGNQCQNQAPIKVRCKCGWEEKSDQLTGRVQSQDLYCPRCGEKFISYPADVVGAGKDDDAKS